MVRGERRKPMDGEIMDPDKKDRHIDRKYPEHKDQDGVSVIVETKVGVRTL